MVDLEKMKIVRFIGERYGSFNPFIIADKLNVPIEWAELGYNLMGKVVYLGTNPIILLNSNLKDKNDRYFVCGHELGHVIKHAGLAGYYLLNAHSRSSFEYEATDFSFYLLINFYKDEFGYLPETHRDLEREYGIPEQ